MDDRPLGLAIRAVRVRRGWRQLDLSVRAHVPRSTVGRIERGHLSSVTVEAIFEAARADGVEARHELVPVADLYTADGLWLVSSGRGPALVTALDGRPLRADPENIGKVARYAGF